jgi:biopolymer transport protein ExbB/TolQ
MLLSWHRSDPERRLKLQAGRFTDVNVVLSLALGCVAAILVYVLIYGVELVAGQGGLLHGLTVKFTQRGWIPYFIVWLFCWGMAILALKRLKLGVQRRALTLAVIPQEHGFMLTPETAAAALERMERIVDNPRHFLLLNRIEIAVSNLRNLGAVSEVSTILTSQAKLDEDQVAGSYNFVNAFIWAIPILGFIGTVLGLGDAMHGFASTVDRGRDLDGIRGSLTEVVTGLATAFDNTFIGLVAAVLLQAGVTFSRRHETRFLDDCNEYCQQHIVAKLRLRRQS